MSDFSTHPAYSRLYAAPGTDEPAAFFPEETRAADQEHLDQLEAQSIFIIREAFHHFKNICMPWSMGKDSNVLIWLSKKAFCGHIPYPLLHIDTTYEFPEMIAYRDWAVKHHELNLIVKINEDARAGRGAYAERGPIGYDTTDPVTVTHELKTMALQQVMAEHKWDALITGIRRDEDPTRAKERYFSPRTKDFEWDYKDQPPEFWNQFTTSCNPGEHVRVQALLDWTERDIWLYIQREGIPIPQMYFARTARMGSATVSARSAAGRSPAPWRVRRTRLTKSSRNSPTPRPANAQAAHKTITSATPCRSSAQKGSCTLCGFGFRELRHFHRDAAGSRISRELIE